MKYDYSEDEKSLTVYFDERQLMQQLLLFIYTDICETYACKIFITIDGIESTIEYFTESCISKNVHLFDNGKKNWFIRNLPTLCLMSEYQEDIIAFCKFMGNFNEGQMWLSFIDSNVNMDLKAKDNMGSIISDIEQNSFARVEVLSDGEVCQITAGKLGYDFGKVLKRII